MVPTEQAHIPCFPLGGKSFDLRLVCNAHTPSHRFTTQTKITGSILSRSIVDGITYHEDRRRLESTASPTLCRVIFAVDAVLGNKAS